MDMKGKRIVVTGATGFLGRHLLSILRQRYGVEHVAGLSSRDYDLLNPVEVRRMFLETKPQVVVHLAAYSGGIGANREFPADFYYRNTMLTALVFHEAASQRVVKMLYPMGGCSYPGNAKSPIDESQMWNGFPQVESAPYSCAKKMGLIASDSYRRQYGLNSTVIVPGNMYGEYDNFHPRDSHVVPAMIRRFYEAGQTGAPDITLWGTGRPVRDFVYAGDVAATIPWFLENDSENGPVNISTGTATSIRELAELVKAVTGYEGGIKWDSTKPDGQMHKVFDVRKLHSLGLSCPTPLMEGLRRTTEWLVRNYQSRGDGLRL